MHCVVLNGFAGADAFGERAASALLAEIQALGHSTDHILLRDRDIAPCTGCFKCWVKTPGECITKDDGRDVARAVATSDLTVMMTPLTFGCYSSTLKKALDRLIPILSPYFIRIHGEIHHQKRYRSYPRLMGLATMPSSDQEAADIFTKLVWRNSLNWHSPACSAGVVVENGSSSALTGTIRSLLAEVGCA